jgi:hypothetical protein
MCWNIFTCLLLQLTTLCNNVAFIQQLQYKDWHRCVIPCTLLEIYQLVCKETCHLHQTWRQNHSPVFNLLLLFYKCHKSKSTSWYILIKFSVLIFEYLTNFLLM